MVDIEQLIERIRAFRDERDWKQFHNPKDMAISLNLEAAELLEHFQWKNEEELEAYVREKKHEISEELADVLYWLLLIANDCDIDLAEAFEKKMKRNEEKYPIEKAKGRSAKYTTYEKSHLSASGR